jgi:hypothetical protein
MRNLKKTILPLILILFIRPSYAQNSWNTSLLGQWFLGPTYAVAVSESLAYFNISNNLQIADFSDFSNPQVLGNLHLNQNARKIMVENNFAYFLMRYYGISIINISNPKYPIEVCNISTQGDANDFCINGNFAYVADGYYGLRIIDITDPVNPFETGSFTSMGYAKNVAVKNNYAFVSDASFGIRVFNISNPYQPQIVYNYPTYVYQSSMTLKNNLIYQVQSYDGLTIIDISNPLSFVQVGHLPIFNSFNEIIAVNNHTALIPDSYNDVILAIDVSDSTNPVIMDTLDLDGNIYPQAWIEDILYVAERSKGLSVFNIENINNPVLQGQIRTDGYVSDIALKDSFLLIADSKYGNGLRILNISDLSLIKDISNFSTNISACYLVRVVDDIAYVGIRQQNDNLIVLDISDIYNPLQIGCFNAGGIPQDLLISGSYAFMSCGYSGVYIYDVSNLNSTSPLGYFDTIGGAYGLELSGNHLYVSDGTEGLRVLNISNPQQPFEEGFINNQYWLHDVELKDNYTCIAAGDSEIIVIDISNPIMPQEISKFDISSGINCIKILGDTLYLGTSSMGLRILDISDFFNPIEIGYYETFGSVYEISIKNETIYLAKDDRGIVVVRNDMISSIEENIPEVLPNKYKLSQNYPNPFNGFTTIPFELQKDGNVEISIYDVLGRKVKTLINKPYTFGKHSITWDGTNANNNIAASGIYFYKLKTNNFSEVKRLLLFQ